MHQQTDLRGAVALKNALEKFVLGKTELNRGRRA